MRSYDPDYVPWLLDQSMLQCARRLSRRYAGQSRFWQRPYAVARPRAATAVASVWFTAYPGAIITREDNSVLRTLADPELWHALTSIGIQGIHLGPMKVAGGIRGREPTPTVDGNFDRIGFGIDPTFGTQEEFVGVSRTAAAHNAVVIDDIIPAHTGKGADFRLAELFYEDYPGLYHMVEIREEDWPLLPEVAEGRHAVNLPPATVDILKDKGYIVGQLRRVIFYEPGIKETDWSVTDIVEGVDGVSRRWAYLHYFKEGQPSLNWLDPSFAAQQMIIGEALHSLDVLGARGLRLDANGFLGVERQPQGPAWSEGHPLSIVGNQLIAGMVRKAGGFTFQELNLTVDDIAMMSSGGADLSYDFVTRPAYIHALVSGSAEFLRMMLRMVHEFGLDPASLIHALQNHDELTLELVHFWTKHLTDNYVYQGKTWSGGVLREHIRDLMYERLAGEHAPYNKRFVTNGIACTSASVIAAVLDIRDLAEIDAAKTELIKKIHLLLAMYNALQPGVFALSGWDLVGALPLPLEAVATLAAEGDTRWIARGAYDLMDVSPDAAHSTSGLPKAVPLYGSLRDQMQDPQSFAVQLKRLLAVRQAHGIHVSRQVDIPDVAHGSLLVMLHELPDNRGMQVTALNFGPDPLEEELASSFLHAGTVIDMLAETVEGEIAEGGPLRIVLEGYGGRSYRILGTFPSPQ